MSTNPYIVISTHIAEIVKKISFFLNINYDIYHICHQFSSTPPLTSHLLNPSPLLNSHPPPLLSSTPPLSSPLINSPPLLLPSPLLNPSSPLSPLLSSPHPLFSPLLSSTPPLALLNPSHLLNSSPHRTVPWPTSGARASAVTGALFGVLAAITSVAWALLNLPSPLTSGSSTPGKPTVTSPAKSTAGGGGGQTTYTAVSTTDGGASGSGSAYATGVKVSNLCVL